MPDLPDFSKLTGDDRLVYAITAGLACFVTLRLTCARIGPQSDSAHVRRVLQESMEMTAEILKGLPGVK